MQVLIGFGGNEGSEDALIARFARAAERLQHRFAGARLHGSRIYRSDPVGPIPDQPRFLNAVLRMELPKGSPDDSVDGPLALLDELLRLETAFGRVRDGLVEKGPRVLDLDLLFVDGEILDTPGPPRLELPHRRIPERAFVLIPIADVMGWHWRMPGIGRTVLECASEPATRTQRVEPVAHERAWLPVSDALQHTVSPP